MKVIIITFFLLLIAIVLLGVKVFFVKGGKFPSSHVHDNEALCNRDIKCGSCNENTNK